ncbi:uncharacterized protein P884DRAFT_75282 [Thermothelomyces heterothallicus CBS 202.75]|uniref:uncharacterized protein n=1 Tax=Thermothelomyces heterothallicus CBS 202.75 TaxID=1149848 RepID=UPI0037437543
MDCRHSQTTNEVRPDLMIRKPTPLEEPSARRLSRRRGPGHETLAVPSHRLDAHPIGWKKKRETRIEQKRTASRSQTRLSGAIKSTRGSSLFCSAVAVRAGGGGSGASLQSGPGSHRCNSRTWP